jgi:hemolysin III
MAQSIDRQRGAETSSFAPLVRPFLRGHLHAIAAALSVGALVWLVRSAHSTQATIAAWVYGLAAVLCYGTSFSYHVLARSDRARRRMRRADHAMIYVLIAGTFTPICILAMAGWWRWLIIGMMWLGVVLGMALSLGRAPRFAVALYIILGWAGVSALPALSHQPIHAVLFVVAGILYTVGAILFGWQRPTLRPKWFGYHEFWHSMVVAAGALLFVVNLRLISS